MRFCNKIKSSHCITIDRVMIERTNTFENFGTPVLCKLVGVMMFCRRNFGKRSRQKDDEFVVKLCRFRDQENITIIIEDIDSYNHIPLFVESIPNKKVVDMVKYILNDPIELKDRWQDISEVLELQ